MLHQTLLLVLAIGTAAIAGTKVCQPNSSLTNCGSACPAKCSDAPGPKVCVMMCLVDVCECNQGFAFTDDGKCVRKEDCPKKVAKRNSPLKCKPNSTFKTCGTKCPLTCEQPEQRPCVRMCNTNVCECDAGFVLNQSGDCVKLDQCPKN